MLDIDMEYRKGILFVRLAGVLDETTASKINIDVSKIINKGGIKYLVYNVENLQSINIDGINAMLDNYNTISNNNGKVVVCGLNNNLVKHRIQNSRLLNYLSETSNELTALNMINL